MPQKRKRRPQRYRLLPPTYAVAGAESLLRGLGFTQIKHETYGPNEVLVVLAEELTEEREKELNKLHWAFNYVRYEGPKPPWYRPAQG